MTAYAHPGTPGALVEYKPRYENWIGGEWVPPVDGRYFENITPVTGKVFTEIPQSNAADIELALDAAHRAAPTWNKTSPAERAALLNRIADVMEANLEKLAVAETWDNGKAVREPLAADIPLAIDHFRYFASAIRTQEGRLSQIDEDTVAYHFHEPLGVVGQIIPWNFPILMATWKLAPALAAGNCVVLKPAEQTPASILYLMELLADIIPPGVVNIVNGFGAEAGKPLASNKRIAKIAFTGETTTGRLIMQYASQNIIPVTLELGGKSPNIFFEDVAAEKDAFYDKALEGYAMFSLNQGEVCTCPSRALIQRSIYDSFLGDALGRVEATVQGDPLDPATQIGAQASNDQYEKILSYIDIGKQEGAKILTGGEPNELGGDLAGGYYIKPTVFEGQQLDAAVPGGDLRPRRRDDLVRGLRRGHVDRQRHALRPRLRGVDAQREHRVPRRPHHPGRTRLGEQLPRLSRARGFRRLQVLGHRPGEPPDDARPLSADQEPAGELLGQRAGLLLSPPRRS
jgi:aldehyde dehydrogenase